MGSPMHPGRDLLYGFQFFDTFYVEAGNANAQCTLGFCYHKGHGVEQSYTEAVKWYRKAAEQGDATAQHNLGFCYDKGRGVEQSYTEAVKWYRKAAEQGDADAIRWLKKKMATTTRRKRSK